MDPHSRGSLSYGYAPASLFSNRPGRGGGTPEVPLHPAQAYVLRAVGVEAAEKMNAVGSLKLCKCKNSSCLKLYCDCFAHGVYCFGCSCTNCLNKPQHFAEVESAVQKTIERNPKAFKPKVRPVPSNSYSPHLHHPHHHGQQQPQPQQQHVSGCKCKKTNCLKKYCECFQAGVFCGDNCQCSICKNVPSLGVLGNRASHSSSPSSSSSSLSSFPSLSSSSSYPDSLPCFSSPSSGLNLPPLHSLPTSSVPPSTPSSHFGWGGGGGGGVSRGGVGVGGGRGGVGGVGGGGIGGVGGVGGGAGGMGGMSGMEGMGGMGGMGGMDGVGGMGGMGDGGGMGGMGGRGGMGGMGGMGDGGGVGGDLRCRSHELYRGGGLGGRYGGAGEGIGGGAGRKIGRIELIRGEGGGMGLERSLSVGSRGGGGGVAAFVSHLQNQIPPHIPPSNSYPSLSSSSSYTPQGGGGGLEGMALRGGEVKKESGGEKGELLGGGEVGGLMKKDLAAMHALGLSSPSSSPSFSFASPSGSPSRPASSTCSLSPDSPSTSCLGFEEGEALGGGVGEGRAVDELSGFLRKSTTLRDQGGKKMIMLKKPTESPRFSPYASSSPPHAISNSRSSPLPFLSQPRPPSFFPPGPVPGQPQPPQSPLPHQQPSPKHE